MKVKATVEMCDNPTCDYEQVLEVRGEPAQGFHFLKGMWVLAGGGPIPAFYAHRRECILPAFDFVMERDQ